MREQTRRLRAAAAPARTQSQEPRANGRVRAWLTAMPPRFGATPNRPAGRPDRRPTASQRRASFVSPRLVTWHVRGATTAAPMLRFRILGPLEVTETSRRHRSRGADGSARCSPRCSCGGPGRADGAAGRRALGATDPPRTAIDVAPERDRRRCARLLGPDVLVTRPPGLRAPRRARAGRRASGSSGCSRRRGVRPTEERRALLAGRSALWRGPRSPSSRSTTWRSPRSGGSRSSGSSRGRSGSPPRSSSGVPPEVVAELESLVAEHPLRERICVAC